MLKQTPVVTRESNAHHPLVKWAKAHNTTLVDLAKKLGVSQSAVSQIVNRRINPSMPLAQKIVKITGVSYDELVTPNLPKRKK